MENSHILSVLAEEQTFRTVLQKIHALDLPVKYQYRDGQMHFYYQLSKDGQIFTKCDGYTAHNLKRIVLSLYNLYRND